MSHAERPLSPHALAAASHGIETLAPTQARTLLADRAVVVRIARGAAWATRRGPHAGTAEGGPQGDLLLEAGARLRLEAGESLVLEPIGVHGLAAGRLAFDWCADEGGATAPMDTAHAVARLARGALIRALQHLPRRTTRGA